MITGYIYKENTKERFSTVKLDLLPEKIVFHFLKNSFPINKEQIIEYMVNKNRITIKMQNIENRSPLVVTIENVTVKDFNKSYATVL